VAADLYDSVSPLALTRCTVSSEVVRHEQDVVPILDANKRDANAFEPASRPMGLRHIARIPNVVALQMMQRGLLDYHGRVADERALLRFLSDPEHRYLRVDNGRRLA
jgi:hypothetical protein